MIDVSRNAVHRWLEAAATAVLAGGASLAFAWLIAQGRGRSAATLLLLCGVIAYVLRRRDNGLLAATAIILLVPFQRTFVVHQLAVPRAASLIAISGMILVAAPPTAVRFRATLTDIATAAIVLFALVSWFLTPHVPSSLQATINALLPLSFYVVARRVSRTALTSLSWVLVVSGAGAAVTVLLEYFVTRRPLFVDPSVYLWNAKHGLIFRPGGVFESPPAAATILTMTALVGLGLYGQLSRGKGRLLTVLIAVNVAGMVVTFTRAALIAFAIGVVAFISLARPSSLPRVAFLGAGAALLFALLFLPSISKQSWYQEGVLRQGNLAVRESYWRQAWPLITNSTRHLVVGHGVNSLLIGRPELPGDPDPDLASAPNLLSIGPHNQYVRTLFEEGLLGLAILGLWLAGGIGLGVKAARLLRFSPEGRYAAAATSALIALCIASFAGDSLRHPPTLAIAAMLVATAVSIGTRGTEVS